MMLHGYGVSASIEEAYLDITAQSDMQGFIYAMPQGTTDSTGNPFWTAASHLVFDGSASKVHGIWLFSHANVPLARVPIP